MTDDFQASATGEAQNKRDKIKLWLMREWSVTELYDPDMAWAIQVSAGERPGAIVVQAKEVPDLLLIQGSVSVEPEMQEALVAMSAAEQQEVLWELRFGLLKLGVEFTGVSQPLEMIMLRKSIYDDALTKDAFLHRVDAVSSAVVFVLWTLQRRMPGLTGEQDAEQPFVN